MCVKYKLGLKKNRPQKTAQKKPPFCSCEMSNLRAQKTRCFVFQRIQQQQPKMRFWSSKIVVADIRRFILTFLSYVDVVQLLRFGYNDHEYQLEIMMYMPTRMHDVRIQRVLAECGNTKAMTLMKTPWVEDVDDWIRMLEFATPDALLATIHHEIWQRECMCEALEHLFSRRLTRNISCANAKIMCEKMPMTKENKIQFISEMLRGCNSTLLDFLLNELEWGGTLPNSLPLKSGPTWQVLEPHIRSGRIKFARFFVGEQLEPFIFYRLVDFGQITKPESQSKLLLSCFTESLGKSNFCVAEYYWNINFIDDIWKEIRTAIENNAIPFLCSLCEYKPIRTCEFFDLCNDIMNMLIPPTIEQQSKLIKHSSFYGNSSLARRILDKTNKPTVLLECLCESLQTPQTRLSSDWLNFVWEYAATLVAGAALDIANFAQRHKKQKLLQFLEEHQLPSLDFL